MGNEVYVAPLVEVIEVEVEKGFTTSPFDLDNPGSWDSNQS